MFVNTWFGTGRLGRDPDMSYTNSGKAVTRFSMAVDQGKDKDTMWLNVVCWDQLAERINELVKKGMEVFVQGRLTMRSYDDKNGVKRTAIDIVASSVQLTQCPPKEEAVLTAADLGDLDDHPF